MSDQQILETFQKATMEAVNQSIEPDLPIKFVMRTFVPPDDQKYVECVFIPNNRENGYWGDEKDYRGMFRLILHWPNDDQGAYPALKVIESIASYFVKGMLLQNVIVSDIPNLTGLIEAGADTLLPCSIRYQSFRS